MTSLLGSWSRMKRVVVVLVTAAIVFIDIANKHRDNNLQSVVGTIQAVNKEFIDDSLEIQIGPFPIWNPSQPVPCFFEPDWNLASTQVSKASAGIFFVKCPKSGSTSGASVTLRIASKMAQRQDLNNATMCRNRVQHVPASRMSYDQRDKTRSILWSVVREPTARTLSHYFHFHVSRLHLQATDEEFVRFMRQHAEMLTSFQLKYLSLQNNITNPALAMQDIFQQYNLVGVTERFDESVVVLQMLLNLTAMDVMYMSAKTSGSYDGGRLIKKCMRIQITIVTPAMATFMQSDEYTSMVHWDKVLHQLANIALDLRIEQLGKLEFAENLETFRALRKRVDETCGAFVRLPCTKDGVLRAANETDCLLHDMGCGFDCIDSLLYS
ncbi:hypothetical protein MPSEU_000690500 [Mayamaea pseudoterrestris]|nr:hypothetical protein MPSEU_000690500 [Mayamaea pseudoterrestris]